ncbi:SurA N-terminal domain-containing protein [Pelagibacteraceae bacterium]|nr:SurA N-terminal domain-containing protein [Pelagibacteraceae bacterium]
MKTLFKIITIGTLLLIGNLAISTTDEKNFKIIKLVNDQVITNFDLEQRIKLLATLNKININSENIDQYARELISLMVDEKLQYEQMKKYNISITQKEVDEYIKKAYSNNDTNQIISLLNQSNINVNILYESIRIKIGWNELTGRLYYRTAKVDPVDLEDAMQQNPTLSEKMVNNILIQRQIELRASKLLRDLKSEANIENR